MKENVANQRESAWQKSIPIQAPCIRNKNQSLPLDPGKADSIAIAGPLADEWLGDWYGGIPPFRHTVADGISALLGRKMTPVRGLDKYRICVGDRAWHIEEDYTEYRSRSSRR